MFLSQNKVFRYSSSCGENAS